MAEKNKTEKKQQTLTEIYNSSEASNNRRDVKLEINSMPRENFSGKFEKDDKEKGELFTERMKWRRGVKNRAKSGEQARGKIISKRNYPDKVLVRL